MKKYKHGRVGVVRKEFQPNEESQNYQAGRIHGYNNGFADGAGIARAAVTDLLDAILEKKRVKDIHGLVERFRAEPLVPPKRHKNRTERIMRQRKKAS